MDAALRPLDLPDAEVAYAPSFLATEEGDALLASLLAGLAWEQHVIRLFGRAMPTPRRSAWYGDPGARYTYSGLTLDPRPWTRELATLRERVERTTGARFNAVLANLYRDGADSMGWHSDDEPELGPEPVIASVSVGAVRRFLMRHRQRENLEPVGLDLAHGSLLLMSGPTQRCWRHALPRTRRAVGPRVNLTFRRIVGVDPG